MRFKRKLEGEKNGGGGNRSDLKIKIELRYKRRHRVS